MRTSRVALTLITLMFSMHSLRAQQLHELPTLEQGTAVPLQLDETLESAHARIGQRVAFEVTGDVVVQGRVLIPAGAAALGTVASVARHGWTGHSWHERAGRLDVNVDAVRLPSGQVVPLSLSQDGSVSPEGSPLGSGTVQSSLSSPGSGSRRRDIRIPEGTVIRAYVRRDTIVVQQMASVSN